MTFLEALKTGRPIRRAVWVKHPPVKSDIEQAARAVVASVWVFLCTMPPNAHQSLWINLATGLPQQLNVIDYTSDDWESMP